MPKILSCVMSQNQLKRKLLETDPEQYAYFKMMFWISLYNDRLKPITWNKPTASGTKCKCIPIISSEELKIAQMELQKYIYKCNEEFNTDYKAMFS